MEKLEKYIEQHKQRLSYMPWLYYSLKQKHLQWALPWQKEVQKKIQELETVHIGKECFISPNAHIFAEPGREIVIGNNVTIAAEAILHGPIHISDGVSINARVTIDGGSKGVFIGKNTRIANGSSIYAFNHGMSHKKPIKEQNITSKGIHIGEDVWIAAQVGITDGVKIGNYCIVGMGAVVTKDLPEWSIAAGVPAKIIRDRRISENVLKTNNKRGPHSNENV